MRTLLSQTNDGETKAYILPMLFSSIEIENSQLQVCYYILAACIYILYVKISMQSSKF